MIVEMVKKANDLVQNVSVSLSKAVDAASKGGDYSEDWEKAMQYQMELLRQINELKYKQSSKPRSMLSQGE